MNLSNKLDDKNKIGSRSLENVHCALDDSWRPDEVQAGLHLPARPRLKHGATIASFIPPL